MILCLLFIKNQYTQIIGKNRRIDYKCYFKKIITQLSAYRRSLACGTVNLAGRIFVLHLHRRNRVGALVHGVVST